MKRDIVKKLNPLQKVDFTKLDYDKIIEEIKFEIQKHPKYKTLWKDFLESNAGQMLLETTSFIINKLILRTDFIANELFLPTATDPQAIANSLKLIGYNLESPTSSVVNIICQSANGQPLNITIPPAYKLSGLDLNGNPITFEIYNENETDYFTPIEINGETSVLLKAFSGELIEEIIKVDKQENFTFSIQYPNVLKDTLKIYLVLDSGEEVLLKPTKSFVLITEEEQEENEYPFYVEETNYDFSKTIYFGNYTFGGAFNDIIENVPETYKTLRILYRIGGGEISNITQNSINTTARIDGQDVIIYNPEAAIGGTDGESIEKAKTIAPLLTKTADKSVTNEDYITLMKQQNEIKIIDANVVSPYVLPDKIPFLFNYIYVLPLRNWENFVVENPEEMDANTQIPFAIPQKIDFETKNVYSQRFNIRLNNFLNMKGFCGLKKILIEVNDGNLIRHIEEKTYDNSELVFPEYNEINGERYFYFPNTEAEILYNFLLKKKVTGVENLFKIAKFTPFSIFGTIYYKTGFNPIDLEVKIKNKLREEFDISKRLFNEKVYISKIYSLIHSFVEVSYFKMDTPQQDINADKNEIVFLLPETIVNKIPFEFRDVFDINLKFERE